MIVRYCTPEDQLYFITADNRSLFKNREFSVVFRGGSAGTSAHTSSSKTRASSGSGSTYSVSRRRARTACDSRSCVDCNARAAVSLHYCRSAFRWLSVSWPCQTNHLTNRWSQPLAVAKSAFDLMKQFSIFATLALASGGSAPSR